MERPGCKKDQNHRDVEVVRSQSEAPSSTENHWFPMIRDVALFFKRMRAWQHEIDSI